MSISLHRPEESLSVDFTRFVVTITSPDSRSPITQYFEHSESLLTRLVKPATKGDAESQSLLMLGLVSSAEFYFRSILAKCTQVCPACRGISKRAVVPLGAIEYFVSYPDGLVFAALEHLSLADSGAIKSLLTKWTGVAVKQGTSVDRVLADFDRLCQIRHAAVHAQGLIGFKAAEELSLPAGYVYKIRIDEATIFELAKISHNTVRGFNRFLFDELLERWIREKRLTGVWERDRVRFSRLYATFCYPTECPFGNNARTAYDSIRAAVRSRLSA